MREKLGWFLFCVCSLLYGSSVGEFVLEKKCLRVLSPDSLKDVYECVIGNFGVGVPQYGGSMYGTVIYPKPNPKACYSFDKVDIAFKSRPGGHPIFLLADRGDCYFFLKARNSQNAGAAAILLADDINEPLITMSTSEDFEANYYDVQNLTIPVVLISRAFGNDIKKALSSAEMVNINLDLGESLPHRPHERVEYEFWTNSIYDCGPKCDNKIEFINNFKGVAQMLEQKGYTKFTPHYMSWYCPMPFILSKQCRSQCINYGRYCALDPEKAVSGSGYLGKDVVIQNLLGACLFKEANQSGKPWLWWDYVTEFSISCSMEDRMYNKPCADKVIKSLGIDIKLIDKCIGQPNEDVENLVLKAEQNAQIGEGTRGDMTILPTLIINNRQHRGKLDKGTVLEAICSSFQQATKPAICFSEENIWQWK